MASTTALGTSAGLGYAIKPAKHKKPPRGGPVERRGRRRVAVRSNLRPAPFEVDVDLAVPACNAGIGNTQAVVDDESLRTRQGEGELLVPAEIRDVSFPGSRRGYDRGAVDAYVERVNRLVAELEVGRSPQAAVRHALDRVAEQVGGILQRARETAEEITASAREEAEESSARGKAEAAALVVDASAEADAARAEGEQLVAQARAEADELLARSRAEADERLQRANEEVAALREQAAARLRELLADTEAVWEDRRELLENIGGLAGQLDELASGAAARLPPWEPPERAEEQLPEPEAAAEREPTGVVEMDQPMGGEATGRLPPRRG